MKNWLWLCAAVAVAFTPAAASARGGPAASKTIRATRKKSGTEANPARNHRHSSAGARAAASESGSFGANRRAEATRPRAGRENSVYGNPAWIPMAAFSGGLGLFTIDSGGTLPKHGATFEIGANKFSRNPGSITVLQTGWSFGYGVTDRLTAFMQFDVHNHVHVDNPAELSLDSGAGPQFGNTI